MSLEPQTTAKVRLHTTKGDIDIELWAKETPITSRVFLTNVLNDKFAGWEFNRVVRDFIVQLDGSLAQEPFEDEFHTRIKYNRRGMLGSVNLSSRNSNTGKFFITLREAHELQNKNTAFGKVVGDGIFAVLKASEGQRADDDDETPLYPVKVTGSEVLIPFFDDLVKEQAVEVMEQNQEKTPKKKAKVRLNLDEEEDTVVQVKMKSAHDVLNDKKLAKEAARIDEHKPQELESTAVQIPISLESTSDDRKDLQGINSRIEQLKEDLNRPQTPVEPIRVSTRPSKHQRETDTLKALEEFQNRLRTTKEAATTHKETEFQDDDLDGFDNLDGSDSDSDIYSHSLKFADNEANSKLANEDLLITIDEKEQVRKKRNDDFYTNAEASSILKKART